jgi:hypothetical protein
MKITEETYFDYLDNLLNAEEIKVFEDHLKNNPEAQEKLDKLKSLDSSISDNFNQEKFDRVTDKFNDQFNNLQKKLDHKEKDENIFKVGIFSKIFTPIIAIPLQSKALLFAAAVGIFFIGNQQSLNNNDQFVDISKKIIADHPALFEENTNNQSIQLNVKNNKIEATPMKSLTLKDSSKNKDLLCASNKITKQIKILQNNTSNNESYYFYCADEDKNNWELHHIQIKVGSDSIDIDGEYKIVSEQDYIYLFPKK